MGVGVAIKLYYVNYTDKYGRDQSSTKHRRD